MTDTRPVADIQADITATQAQHAQHMTDGQAAAKTLADVKAAKEATAEKLRGLVTELKTAVGSVETAVEGDIKQVEDFFDRAWKDIQSVL